MPAKQPADRKREKGVAIILSLGVLALMLVYTLSFAMAALNNQKFAELNRALTEVRTESESRVQMIMNQMATSYANSSTEANFYPGTDPTHMLAGSGDWAGFRFTGSTFPANRMTDELVPVIGDTVDGLELVPDSIPNNILLSWIPFYKERTIDGADVTTLYGRYAYLLIDESGKLDPNSVLDSGVAEGTEPLEGVSLSELNLTTAGISAAFASKLSSPPSNADWFSRYHVIRALSPSQSELTALRDVGFAQGYPDIIKGQELAATVDLGDLSSYDVPKLVGELPWLTNWSVSGNFPLASSRANNLAANILDYADADGDARRDSDDAPTYWGTEKVPWLSRVVFRVTNRSYLTNGNSRTVPRIGIECQPELVNAFGDLSDTYVNCYVNVEVEVRMTDQNDLQKVRTLTFEFNPMTANWNSSGYYRPVGYSPVQYHTSEDINDVGKWELRDIGLRVVRVTAHKADQTEAWDYGQTTECTLFQLDAPGDLQHTEFAAINHASNLHASEWRSEAPSLLDPLTSPVVEPPSWWETTPLWIRNGPFQHVVELGAILRMEPFDEASAENGFRTFNLIEYKFSGDSQEPGLYSDASDSVVYDLDGPPDDDELNGGDRNLLDMVRVDTMGVFERIEYGRININTPHRKVLEALFKRVSSQVYTGGAPIDEARIDQFITNLLAYTGSEPIPVGLYSNYRNPPLYGLLFNDEIAGDPDNGGVNALTEMEREYLLTMTQQLVSAEHNYFKLYVIAQLIRDSGGKVDSNNNPLTQYGVYDLGEDKILVEQKMKVIIYRNAFTNHIRILRKQFLAE